jgi:anti-sigma factor RsiW
MRCDEVAALLPALVDASAPPNIAVEHHIESCLRCQAELARYRRLLRTLHQLRSRFVEPAPGLLGETLAALDLAERRAMRSLLHGRRLAYAGAIGGTAVATAATAALLIARSRSRRGPLTLAS